MAYNTKQILLDVQQSPIPQYFNQTTDVYEPLLGENGAARHVLYGPDGNPISTTGNKLAVRASEIESQLTTIQGYVDGLETALGEVQDAPTANTLLARIKSLETKIDAIIAGTSPAAVQLTGSSLSETQALPIYGKSIEEIILFNAVAVADTNLRSSPLVDFRKYQKVIIESVTTLDQMIDLWFLVAGKWGYMLVNDTWTRNNITKVTIPTIGGGGTYLWPIDIRINEQTIFYLQATTAPTTGSITVKAWGVPN